MNDLVETLESWVAMAVGFLPLLLIIGTIFAFTFGQKAIDRSRIESSLATYGWLLLDLKRHTAFFSRSERSRRYFVTYQTHTGTIITAECRVSWLEGPQWISNTPFGY